MMACCSTVGAESRACAKRSMPSMTPAFLLAMQPMRARGRTEALGDAVDHDHVFGTALYLEGAHRTIAFEDYLAIGLVGDQEKPMPSGDGGQALDLLV